MRSLSRREAVAVLASILVEYLYKTERYAELITVTGVILGHYPLEINAILARSSACARLLDETKLKFPHPSLAPSEVVAKMRDLMERNMAAFSIAENLGWIPFEEEEANAR